jgi:hypothetical protein
MTGPTTSWSLQRSRVPDLLAAAMVAASGSAAMASDGWLWWAGAAALAAGLMAMVVSARRRVETVCLTLGERVRLERVAQGQPGSPTRGPDAGGDCLISEGLLDGGSVVTPWLLALRIRSEDGHCADLVLTPGCAPADAMRRLRVRLLTDESLRA